MSERVSQPSKELAPFTLKEIQGHTNVVVFTLFGAFLGVSAGDLPDNDHTRELIFLAIGTLIVSTMLIDAMYRAYFAHWNILGLVLSLVFLGNFGISFSTFQEITGNAHLIEAIFISWGLMSALGCFEAIAKGREQKVQERLEQSTND